VFANEAACVTLAHLVIRDLFGEVGAKTMSVLAAYALTRVLRRRR